MSLTDEDFDKEMLDILFTECEELLVTIETYIKTLSDIPDDAEAIRGIFRAVHTIKGGAGPLGVQSLFEFTDIFETALENVRESARPIDETALATLTSAADILSALVEAEKNGKKIEKSITEPSREKLAELAKAYEPSADNQEPEEKVANSANHQIQEHKQTTMRVDVERINQLVNRFSELVVKQNEILQITKENPEKYDSELRTHIDDLSNQINILSDSVLEIRMQDMHVLFSRLPRVGRTVAEQIGKKVEITSEGGETEIDRAVLEDLADPLLHMIRNAVDHGIETPDERRKSGKNEVGRILIRAERQANFVAIDMIDDGRGLDLDQIRSKALARGLISRDQELTDAEIVNLIFKAGFSTNDDVSAISGRGVGMDVVGHNIRKLGGRISLKTTPGKGSEFRLIIPLSVAIVDAHIVEAEGNKFAIPQTSIHQIISLTANMLNSVTEQGNFIAVEGELIAAIYLNQIFFEDHNPNSKSVAIGVVLDMGPGQKLVLIVDEVIDSGQYVIKALEENYKTVRGISGAAMLGTGDLALVINVSELAHNLKTIQPRPTTSNAVMNT